MRHWLRRARFMIAAGPLCVSTAMAQAAGLQLFEVPAEAGEPALATAAWYPCTAPIADLKIGNVPVKGRQGLSGHRCWAPSRGDLA
jgi:hypothetical protein